MPQSCTAVLRGDDSDANSLRCDDGPSVQRGNGELVVARDGVEDIEGAGDDGNGELLEESEGPRDRRGVGAGATFGHVEGVGDLEAKGAVTWKEASEHQTLVGGTYLLSAEQLPGQALADVPHESGILIEQNYLLGIFSLWMDEVAIVAEYNSNTLSGVTNPAKLIADFNVVVERPFLKGKCLALELRGTRCTD